MEKLTVKIDAEIVGSIASIYKEELYQTKDGRFILYCICPASSALERDFKHLTESEARDWVWDNLGPGRYIEIFE